MNLNNYDGIIFDLDGTLWDATKVNKRAWDAAYEEMGFGKSTVTDEEFKSCMGMLIPDIARKIHPDLKEEEILHYVDRSIELEHEFLIKEGGILYDGFYEVLDSLSRTHQLCVVSNCQAGYIEIFLKVHGAEKYFTDFECPGNTGLLKADNIKLVAERNGFKNPVYVGDTLSDMNSAHQAGVPFVWASYGFGKDLTGYEHRVSSIRELANLTDK
ncbi:MAG: HAD family hydrolase [Lachnospiraceae bacterium]